MTSKQLPPKVEDFLKELFGKRNVWSLSKDEFIGIGSGGSKITFVNKSMLQKRYNKMVRK